MKCARSRKTPKTGYNHATACQMVAYALHTGKRVTFDDQKQDLVLSWLVKTNRKTPNPVCQQTGFGVPEKYYFQNARSLLPAVLFSNRKSRI